MKSIRFTFVAVCLSVTAPAFGAVINVPAERSTIQDGLDDATPGDIVLVADGTYIENLVWPDEDGIILWSANIGPGICTIDGSMTGESVVKMTGSMLTRMTELKGFTIINGGGTLFEYEEGSSALCGGGILVYGGAPTIRNCYIWENSATLGGGMFLGFSSAIVRNNVIAGQEFDGNSAEQGGGVYIHEGSPGLVNNTITFNLATLEYGGGGIYSYNSGASVASTIIYHNSPDQVVLSAARENVFSITYSDVEGGWEGLQNIGGTPDFQDPEDGDFILSSGSPCEDAGDPWSKLDLDLSIADIGAHGGNGDVFPDGVIGGEKTGLIESKRAFYIVAEDLVVPAGKRGVLEIEPGVRLDFHNRSGLIVQGELIAEGMAGSEIVFSRSEDWNWDKGAGIRFYEASGSMSHCRVEHMENTLGGGIYLKKSSLEVSESVILGNSAEYQGGGLTFWGGEEGDSLTITDSFFSNNSAGESGGGIRVENSVPDSIRIEGCTISNNSTSSNGGGISFNATFSGSNPTVVNCTIVNNSAVSGDGGGIFCDVLYSPAIQYCTIADNTAGARGGGLFVDESATIVNTILWGNEAQTSGPQIEGSTVSVEVEFSDIQGIGWEGPDNKHEDPEFMGGGNYHLRRGSPCIDEGRYIEAVEFDIDGDLRPQGGGYDIGADEYRCWDDDGDGYDFDGCGGYDCDDDDPWVNPGAIEGPSGDPTCHDEIDNDCDGQVDPIQECCFVILAMGK